MFLVISISGDGFGNSSRELLVAGVEGSRTLLVVSVHLNNHQNTNNTSDSPEDGSGGEPGLFRSGVHFEFEGNNDVRGGDEHVVQDFLHE